MALSFQLEDVKDFKEKFYYKDGDGFQMRVTGQMLIFATMSIGMSEITEENVGKFFDRISIYEKCVGPTRWQNGEPKYFTYWEIREYIGLKTNASNLTDVQFRKQIFDHLKKDARSCRKQQEKAGKQAGVD